MAKRPRTIRTPVTVEGRRFTVVSNKAGVVLRIDERKIYGAGQPWECVYDAVYWHHAHGTVTHKNMPGRIINAAKETYAAS